MYSPTKEDTLHLELVLQCFNSLHLDECFTTEDTLYVKVVIDDNNSNAGNLSLHTFYIIPSSYTKMWIDE